MSLELEYPVNLLILTVVVVVIIGIIWNFRDQIMNIHLFPDQEKVECDSKTVVSHEIKLDLNAINKYCQLCWDKNKRGECGEDNLCYVVNINSSSVPTNPSETYCKNLCTNSAKTIFVQYNYLKENIEITC
jgi:hypothetical protein